MDDTTLCFNGINGATGADALPPMALADFARAVAEVPGEPRAAAESKERLSALTASHLGTVEGIDRRRLAEAGWGVILPPGLDPAVREALAPLLELRREGATAEQEARYREIVYTPESDLELWPFLNRHEVDYGPANPEKLPYYLLLVGSPQDIPWEFQIELDVEYAVGRLCLPSAEDYARYADAVVEAERGRARVSPKATIFATQHAGDRATTLSHDHLALPLLETLAASGLPAGFKLEALLAEDATRANFEGLLRRGATPSFLLTASHGLWYPADDPRRRLRQGALLCQDWVGREAGTGAPVLAEHAFAGEDLLSSAQLSGLIALVFACYGGGTPRRPAFEPMGVAEAREDFVAHLPQRLLRQGAGAVIAHVDQAWAYSYLGLEGGERPETLLSVVQHLLAGHPVGSAVEYLNHRYLQMKGALADETTRIQRHGKNLNDQRYTRLWTATHDARGYVVLGDPAVRLRNLPAA